MRRDDDPGTLYGQTSPAGALTIQSTDPNLEEIDGYVRQSFTEHAGSNTQFGVSLPVIQNKLGFRIAGLYDTNENSDLENVTQDHDLENETTAYRVVGLWTPTGNFDLRLAYWRIEDDNDLDPMVQGNGFDVNDRTAVADSKSFLKNRTDLWALESNYVFANDWIMTFAASDQDSTVKRPYDEDASEVFAQTIYTGSPVDTETYELRLASQGNTFWDWTAGVFYFESDTFTEVDIENYQAVFPGFTVYATGEAPADLSSDTWAVFSHNSIHLTENGTLTVGLRYTETERDSRQDTVLDIFRVLPDDSLVFLTSLENEGVLPEDQEGDDDAVTGTLKYQYRFTEDFMAYASYDRGWVAGSANIAGSPQPPVFGAFDGEDTDNFEVGFKWDLMDGRGLWNLAIYYQVYTDFHYNAESVQFRGLDGGISQESPVVNVDEAESYGLDTDFTILLSENWSLRAGLSYNEAELSDAKDTPCNSDEEIGEELWSYNTCDLTGERAGAEPECSANMASEYFDDFGGDKEWYIRGLFNAESEYYSLSEGKDLDDYAQVDAYFGLRSASRSWDANIWIKNLTDESAVLKTETRVNIPDYATGTMVENPYIWIRRSLDPRTIGVTVEYNF